MASSGPNSPGTAANDSSNGGGVAWSNVNNSFSSNNVYASASLGTNGKSYYLKLTNFGFAISGGATIDGVIVEVECSSSIALIRDEEVSLVKGGTVSGSNLADFSYWSDSGDTTISHGGASNLWGLSLTPTDINSSNFGVVISITNDSLKFTCTGYVDHVKITVYYTEVSGTPRSQAMTIG